MVNPCEQSGFVENLFFSIEFYNRIIDFERDCRPSIAHSLFNPSAKSYNDLFAAVKLGEAGHFSISKSIFSGNFNDLNQNPEILLRRTCAEM